MFAARRLTMLPAVRLTLSKRFETTAVSAFRQCRTPQALKASAVVPKALSSRPIEGTKSHSAYADLHREKMNEIMLYLAIQKLRTGHKQ